MKLINLLYMLVLVALFSCEADEIRPISHLSVKLHCSSFKGATDREIRGVEEGYKTVFKGGEQIGITALKDGVIYHDMDNVPFTYDAATDTWKPTNNTLPQLYYYPGLTYIAYYPYDATMSGKKSEQEIIDAFTPQTDQSTYAAYTASDLMTREASVTGSDGAYTLTFDLQHRMAMVEASIYTKYFTTSLTDGYDYFSFIDYPVKEINQGKFKIDGTEYSSCAMGNGAFRVLFKPTQTERSVQFNFQLAEGQKIYEYQDPINRQITGGKYYLYSITTPKSTPAIRQVEPGDFYYNTGSILPYDAMKDGEEIPFKTDCIGIVFYAGAGPGDTFDNYSTENLTGPDIHGYVVALKDAYPSDTDKKWGPRNQFFGYNEATQFNGYAKRSYADNTDWRCQAAAEIRNFRIAVPTPPVATDWYLPSIAQLQAIWNVYKHSAGNPVYDSLQKAGGELFASNWYWSVTEISNHDVRINDMQTGGIGASGKCSGYDMNQGWNAYSGIHLTRVIFTF